MSLTVDPKNKFDEHVKFTECYKELQKLLEGMSNTSEILKEADTIELICNLVENKYNAIKKLHRKKINKKEVVLTLIRKFLNLTEAETKMIDSIIEHLHTTGRIKLISFSKWLKKSLYQYFQPKK